MPNLKIYIDEIHYPQLRDGLAAALDDLRAILCARLEVTPEACQLAVLPVMAIPGQPELNAELHLMPRPTRTRERLQEVGTAIRDRLGAASGFGVAVRIAQLDPGTYLALK